MRILPIFIFATQNIYQKKKQQSRNLCVFYTTPCSFVVLFVIASRGFGHDTSLYYVITTHRSVVKMCGSVAYKFFQNWLRVTGLAPVRSTLILFRRRPYGLLKFYANKEPNKKTCLKTWLVKEKKKKSWTHDGAEAPRSTRR